MLYTEVEVIIPERFHARWPLEQDVLDPPQSYRRRLDPTKRCRYPLYQTRIPVLCLLRDR